MKSKSCEKRRALSVVVLRCSARCVHGPPRWRSRFAPLALPAHAPRFGLTPRSLRSLRVPSGRPPYPPARRATRGHRPATDARLVAVLRTARVARWSRTAVRAQRR
jgi:hypothetical protein